MSETAKKNTRSAGVSAVVPRLFVLELNVGLIHSMNTDGSDRKTIVTDAIGPTASSSMLRLAISTGPTWASQT